MAEMDPLERLIRQETFAEVVAAMTPEEKAIAALRLEGLSDRQIGKMLGVYRSEITLCMAAAQVRIAEQVPDARDWVLGRQVPRGPRPIRGRPLEHGWICRWFWG
jgi:DNA-directed RNA polymerase specialized sigma24 family protein